MSTPVKIVFVDDDKDDHFLFARALEELPIPTELVSLHNGEKLMEYLTKNIHKLPDVIFLDLNMPRKNGSECLLEIKANKKVKHIPIIIYSTSFHTHILDVLYRYGASYCIRKSSDLKETRRILTDALDAIVKHNRIRPERENFVLGFTEQR